MAESTLGGPRGLRLAVAVLGTTLLFAVCGSLLGVISKADWRFARNWTRLKLAR